MPADTEPLAIVGMALRFPQEATSMEPFWRMLEEKRCAMTEIPRDRMNIDSFYSAAEERVDTLNFRGGHFLKQPLGEFDAPFFSISPAEAAAMDPQQRHMLEVAYHAFENAGVSLSSLAGSKTAVFTGSFADDHKMLSVNDPERLSKYAGSGTSLSILANRLSWWFDLRGPSMNIDTACSSGLVALHLASQSLRDGDSTMALVGGCNILSSMDQCLRLSNLGLTSPSSHSLSFDSRGNGYGRGEGFGVIVVKTLSNALANGDTIRAVIRATGVNQDGKTPSLTSPSQEAQETLIRETYLKAGIDPVTTTYVEAHGTGTKMGDAIEANSLGKVFGTGRQMDDPLYIGALKSNIGHLEGGSGIAGLIKTVLILERGVIPPNANFETVNPSIDMDNLKIVFPQSSITWPTEGLRRASVNSFGFGGTNSIVIVDDACNYLRLRGIRGNHASVDLRKPNGNHISAMVGGDSPPSGEMTLSPKPAQPRLLVLSGSNKLATSGVIRQYSEFLESLPPTSQCEQYLGDLAYTLACRRSSLPSRAFAVITSFEDLSQLSRLFSQPEKIRRQDDLLFVFTGQGAQYSEMGKQLLLWPVFRRSLERSCSFLERLGCTWKLIDELTKPSNQTNIHGAEYSQPICTALQIALVDLLEALGVSPRRVVGHSSGEIAAAYSCGALCAESSLRIAFFRGRAAGMLEKLKLQGAMLAAGLSETAAAVYVDHILRNNPTWCLCLACINSPSSVTFSGDEKAIAELKAQLQADSIFVRDIRVSVAYHSPHMEHVSEQYRELIDSLEPRSSMSPNVATMISSVTGQVVKSSELIEPTYWVQNMVSPVLFLDAVRQAAALSLDTRQVAVEIGPHPALGGPVKEIFASGFEDLEVDYVSTLQRKQDAGPAILNAMGKLYCLGWPVSILAANGMDHYAPGTLKVLPDLPEYPFDHSRSYEAMGGAGRALQFRDVPRLDLLGAPLFSHGPTQMGKRWRKLTKVQETPWIMDHVVNGTAIYPAAGMLCMAIEAIHQLDKGSKPIASFHITDAEFLRPMRVYEKESTESQIELRNVEQTSSSSLAAHFVICTIQSEKWEENCRGSVRVEYHEGDFEQLTPPMWDISEACNYSDSPASLYGAFDSIGLNFGMSFRSLDNILSGSNRASAQVSVFDWPYSEAGRRQDHIIHPITLDGVFQTILAALVQGGKEILPTAVPTKLSSLWISGNGVSHPSIATLQAFGRIDQRSSRTCTSSAFARTPQGELVISISNLETTFVDAVVAKGQDEAPHLCFNLGWKPDIDLLDKHDVLPSFSSSTPCRGALGDLRPLFHKVGQQTLDSLNTSTLHSLPLYKQQYLDWLKECMSDPILSPSEGDVKTGAVLDDSTPIALDRVSTSCETALTLVGEHLPSILNGTQDALELLFTSNLAHDIYIEFNARTELFVKELTSLLAFKEPGLNVLEVGAGTGATTEHILKYAAIDTEDKGQISAISSYEFTDVSASFFGPAKERFSDHLGKMKFSILDISVDPASQGFQYGTYDLIVAANVLHATENLDTTLTHVRKLLKSGGKLLLIEISDNFWLPQMVFGTLPSWWLSRDQYRTCGPLVPPHVWDEVLAKNGFSGLDKLLPDSEDPKSRLCSVFLSTASEKKGTLDSVSQIAIVARKESTHHFLIGARLQSDLETVGSTLVTTVTLDDIGSLDLPNTFCISLLEVSGAMLHSMDEVQYLALRSLLSETQGTLWVRDLGESTAELALSDGLLRILRLENPHSRYINYGLSPDLPVETAANTILRVFRHVHSVPLQRMEPEYRYIDGCFHITRAVPTPIVDKHISIFPGSSGQNVDRDGLLHSSTTKPLDISSNVPNHNTLFSSESSHCVFEPNATYIIAGGFGGLARNISLWMASRGARNLILLSRSGLKHPKAHTLLEELSQRCVRVEAPPCDISSFSQLEAVLSQCASNLPPIKGCVQGALLLQDSVFEKMTYEEWNVTLGARVQGTQNLHSLLPRKLDFFLLLSSVCGVAGMVSQANYAASSTYLDAFAHCHSTSAAPIYALDLGWMEFSGTVAESQALSKRMQGLGYLTPIQEYQFLGLLDFYCDVRREASRKSRQIIIGLTYNSELVSNPMDQPLWRALRFLSLQSRKIDNHSQKQGQEEKALEPLSSLLANSTSLASQISMVSRGFLQKLSSELGVEEAELDLERSAHDIGADSLMAVNLRSWFRKELNANVSVFDIMANISARELCRLALEKSPLMFNAGPNPA